MAIQIIWKSRRSFSSTSTCSHNIYTYFILPYNPHIVGRSTLGRKEHFVGAVARFTIDQCGDLSTERPRFLSRYRHLHLMTLHKYLSQQNNPENHARSTLTSRSWCRRDAPPQKNLEKIRRIVFRCRFFIATLATCIVVTTTPFKSIQAQFQHARNNKEFQKPSPPTATPRRKVDQWFN